MLLHGVDHRLCRREVPGNYYARNFMRNHFLHNLELPLVGEVAHIRHFSRSKKLYAARRKIFIVASYCERRTVYRGFEYHSVEAVLAAY